MQHRLTVEANDDHTIALLCHSCGVTVHDFGYYDPPLDTITQYAKKHTEE